METMSREKSKGYYEYKGNIFVMKNGTVTVKLKSLPPRKTNIPTIFEFKNAYHTFKVNPDDPNETLLYVYDSEFETDDTAIVLFKVPESLVIEVKYVR